MVNMYQKFLDNDDWEESGSHGKIPVFKKSCNGYDVYVELDNKYLNTFNEPMILYAKLNGYDIEIEFTEKGITYGKLLNFDSVSSIFDKTMNGIKNTVQQLLNNSFKHLGGESSCFDKRYTNNGDEVIVRVSIDLSPDRSNGKLLIMLLRQSSVIDEKYVSPESFDVSICDEMVNEYFSSSTVISNVIRKRLIKKA